MVEDLNKKDYISILLFLPTQQKDVLSMKEYLWNLYRETQFLDVFFLVKPEQKQDKSFIETVKNILKDKKPSHLYITFYYTDPLRNDDENIFQALKCTVGDYIFIFDQQRYWDMNREQLIKSYQHSQQGNDIVFIQGKGKSSFWKRMTFKILNLFSGKQVYLQPHQFLLMSRRALYQLTMRPIYSYYKLRLFQLNLQYGYFTYTPLKKVHRLHFGASKRGSHFFDTSVVSGGIVKMGMIGSLVFALWVGIRLSMPISLKNGLEYSMIFMLFMGIAFLGLFTILHFVLLKKRKWETNSVSFLEKL